MESGKIFFIFFRLVFLVQVEVSTEKSVPVYCHTGMMISGKKGASGAQTSTERPHWLWMKRHLAKGEVGRLGHYILFL